MHSGQLLKAMCFWSKGVFSIQYYRILRSSSPEDGVKVARGSFDACVEDGRLRVLTLTATEFNQVVDSPITGFHLKRSDGTELQVVVWTLASGSSNGLIGYNSSSLGRSEDDRRRWCKEMFRPNVLHMYGQCDPLWLASVHSTDCFSKS